MQAARGTSLISSARQARGIAFAIAGIGLAVDEASKAYAVQHLADRAPVHVIGDFVQFTFTRNPGAAFSTGTGLTPVITVIAAVAAVAVVWFLRRVRSAIWVVALGLLLAGILGNLADRMFRSPGPFRGHVVDFIAFPHWPVFNVADVCINIAAALIVLQVFRGVHADGTRAASEAGDA